jgi:molecular chaperone DnaJ
MPNNVNDFIRRNYFYSENFEDRTTDGDNIEHHITLKLEELVEKDLKKDIKIEQKQLCTECNGSRIKKEFKDKDINCSKCGGKGKVFNVEKRANFILKQVVTCPNCQGSGKTIKDEYKCASCKGDGFVNKEKTINVKIPVGITHGSALRLSNEGHCSLDGGENGDLFVVIEVEEHPVFVMTNSNHLYMKLPISFSEAALGCEIEIPSIYKKNISIDIPAGIQNDNRIIKEGYGLPAMNKTKGDLIIDISVITPEKLTKEEENLFKELSKNTFDVRKNIEQYKKEKSL